MVSLLSSEACKQGHWNDQGHSSAAPTLLLCDICAGRGLPGAHRFLKAMGLWGASRASACRTSGDLGPELWALGVPLTHLQAFVAPPTGNGLVPGLSLANLSCRSLP